jgi:hypothetical protein
MDRPPATGSTWTCPSCRRLVPSRLEQCRCGMARGAAAPAGATPEDEPRRGLSLGEAAALLVMVVAAVVGYRGLRGGSSSRATSGRAPAQQAESAPVAAPSAGTPAAAALGGGAAPVPSTTAPRPSSWNFELPPAASDRGSDRAQAASPVASASPVSDVDIAREQGRRKLEAAIQRMAVLRSQMVRLLQYHSRNCTNEHAADPTCQQVSAQLISLAIVVGAVLDDAEDAARTSWLPPGEVRDLRKRYGFDTEAWDEIVRFSREFRR